MEGLKKIGYSRNIFMNRVNGDDQRSVMTGISLEGYYTRQDEVKLLVPLEEIMKQGFICGITLDFNIALECPNKHYCYYDHNHLWSRGITFVHYDPIALFSFIDEMAELFYDETCYRDSNECRTYLESRQKLIG